TSIAHRRPTDRERTRPPILYRPPSHGRPLPRPAHRLREHAHPRRPPSARAPRPADPHVARRGLALPGGGSFNTAQNTPRSPIAATNSLKSTGLTTYAFTPSR